MEGVEALQQHLAMVAKRQNKMCHSVNTHMLGFYAQDPVAIGKVEIDPALRKMFKKPRDHFLRLGGFLDIGFEYFYHHGICTLSGKARAQNNCGTILL